MNFSQALELLKKGKKVTRKGWGGGVFIYYVSEDKYPAKMNAAKELADKDGLVKYSSYIAMKTHQGYVTPWIASQIDLLSEDWEIINSEEDALDNADKIKKILSEGYYIAEDSNCEGIPCLYLVREGCKPHNGIFIQKIRKQ